jgi:hypothetical protein
MLGEFAAFPYDESSIKSESDVAPASPTERKAPRWNAYWRMRQIRSLQNEPTRRCRTECVSSYFENCQ